MRDLHKFSRIGQVAAQVATASTKQERTSSKTVSNTNIFSSQRTFVLVEITAPEVDCRRFTTVSTSSHAANCERADISNRPNFAHERSQSVHPRGWVRKWLYQVVWERVCAHRLRVVNSFANCCPASEQGSILFTTSVGGGGVAARGNVYARFPVPVRGKRYRDGHVAHIPSSDMVGLQRILRRTSAQDHVGGTPSGRNL